MFQTAVNFIVINYGVCPAKVAQQPQNFILIKKTYGNIYQRYVVGLQRRRGKSAIFGQTFTSTKMVQVPLVKQSLLKEGMKMAAKILFHLPKGRKWRVQVYHSGACILLIVRGDGPYD